MKARILLFPLILVAASGYAEAQIPEQVSYQGYLEQAGSPVDDPTATLTFRLFDTPTGGTALWTETHTDVAVESGVFSVLLGSVVSLASVEFDEARFLSVALGDGSASQLSPRTLLASVPYSLSSRGFQLPFSGSAAATFPESVFAIESTGTGTGIGVSSGWAGIIVESAGDGVYVRTSGNPSGGTTSSGLQNAFEVGATGGNGLWVGVADRDGVHVNIARDNGVGVYTAHDDGVYVREAGTPSKNIAVPLAHNGFEVAGAEASGLMVGRADQSGVRIIESGTDGVLVEEAGSPSTTSYSLNHNGLEVRGAEGHGLYVGRADADGVHVNSAGGLAGYFGGDMQVTGDVGIGTTSPSAQLEVREGGSSRTALHVWSDVSGGIPGSTFEAHNASSGSGIAATFTTAGTDATLIIQQNGSGPIMKGYASGKKFQVDAAGNIYTPAKVGVGTESPSARLHVAGAGGQAGFFGGNVEVSGDVTVHGDIINPSDARLKENTRSIPYGLREILMLRPVAYETDGRPGDETHLGLIAQEVELVIGEVVAQPASPDEHYGLSYVELIPVLIKAIQEQQAELEALRTELAAKKLP